MAYRALYRAHLDKAALNDIRKALSRGQPLGSQRFQEQVEAALGKRLAPKRRERRREEKATLATEQMALEI